MRLTTFHYGVIVCIGGLIQILTSVFWVNIKNIVVGESVFMIGQSFGELCYLFACRKLLIEYGYFVAVMEYLISLVVIDIISILFLDPYEMSLPKYSGFIIASWVLLLRINKYDK